MAAEESHGKDINPFPKLHPKYLGGFSSAFQKEESKLLQQTSGRRTIDNTPSILPRLPGDAHYFLDQTGITFYELENRMGIKLALHIQQALDIKAGEKGLPKSDNPDRDDNPIREPYFPKSLVEIGETMTLLTQPKTEIPDKIDTELTEEPTLMEKDYPVYKARLSPIGYIHEHDEDDNPTGKAIIDEGVQIAIFPRALRTYYSPEGRIRRALTGCRPDEVKNMLSLRGRDAGEVQAIIDSYQVLYPYLALENREWEYRVTIQNGTMVSVLRNKKSGATETLVSAFSSLCLSEPPKTAEQCEDRFTYFCQEIINHFDTRKEKAKKDTRTASK